MGKMDVLSRDIDGDINVDNESELEKIKCVKSLRALLSKRNPLKEEINPRY